MTARWPEVEPPADVSWLKMEPVSGRRSWLLGWTVEGHRRDGGHGDLTVQPTFILRRNAERYARKHTCEHVIYTVVRTAKDCACSTRARRGHPRGGYTSDCEIDLDQIKVPGGPAPGARGQAIVRSAQLPPRATKPPDPPPVASIPSTGQPHPVGGSTD
ncbi:MAG TPA: hypothetical protein VFW64_12185 [Pseudonocardiaceae bacterium]|nr:hypothetical protein [Pseudonocardiaceae bacterium]